MVSLGGIARKFGGTGLGLAISKEITDTLGGQITLNNRLADGKVVARSAGSRPAPDVHPHVRSLLTEIEGEQEAETAFPKPLTDDAVRAADVVVTMGCGDACPVYPGRRYLDWDLDDPVDQPLATVRRIRDDIDNRVRHLLVELFTQPSPI